MNKRHSVIILFSFIFTACTDTPHTISESHLYESVSQVVEQARETVDLNLLNQAKLGNAKSQRQLGVYYEDNGAYSEAFYWFKKSAEQGYVIGQYNLAHCYLKGSGISKDLSKAFYWFEQAASQNDSPAQYNLGTMYLNGEGVIKDIQKGIYWLKRSAQSNFKLALYKLGRFYHTGQYIPKNNKIALDLLKKAANQGYVPAQSYLGIILYDGVNISQNKKYGLYWIERASHSNDPNALIKMAMIYASGIDKPQDFYKAYELAEKSCLKHKELVACSFMRELTSPK